jgi:hypothetical protein
MKRRAFLTLGIGIFYLIISFSVNFLYSTIYGSISGKVIGEDTGERIKGIHIVLYTLDGYTVAFANTDKEGNFQFRMLKEGYYSLQFVPPSPYLLSPYWNKSRQERLKDGKVKLEKGQNIHIVKSLKVGGIISGFVYKEDGVTPLEGVQIFAFPTDKYWDDLPPINVPPVKLNLQPLEPVVCIPKSCEAGTCYIPCASAL